MNGRIPVICDTSPCTQTIKNKLRDKMMGFSVYEPVEFVNHFCMDRLEFDKVKENVAIHIPCSRRRWVSSPTSRSWRACVRRMCTKVASLAVEWLVIGE